MNYIDPNIDFQLKGSRISTGMKLRPGAFLFAEVKQQLKHNTYIINIRGTNLTAKSTLKLSVGQRIEVQVEESFNQIKLKIMPDGSLFKNNSTTYNSFIRLFIAFGIPLEGKSEQLLNSLNNKKIDNLKKAALYILLKDKGLQLDKHEWESFCKMIDDSVSQEERNKLQKLYNSINGKRFDSIILPIFDRDDEKGFVTFTRERISTKLTISFNIKSSKGSINFQLKDNGQIKELKIYSEINSVREETIDILANNLNKYKIKLDKEIYPISEYTLFVSRENYLEEQILGEQQK